MEFWILIWNDISINIIKLTPGILRRHCRLRSSLRRCSAIDRFSATNWPVWIWLPDPGDDPWPHRWNGRHRRFCLDWPTGWCAAGRCCPSANPSPLPLLDPAATGNLPQREHFLLRTRWVPPCACDGASRAKCRRDWLVARRKQRDSPFFLIFF